MYEFAHLFLYDAEAFVFCSLVLILFLAMLIGVLFAVKDLKGK